MHVRRMTCLVKHKKLLSGTVLIANIFKCENKLRRFFIFLMILHLWRIKNDFSTEIKYGWIRMILHNEYMKDQTK